ncbi:putative Ig domain-containing protein [Vibrio campbellii]|uniref:Ig domain-containing protein n=3 Tax=Vibrio TaxID=662 RepID=A0AAQ2Y0W2_9VIBR|nr:putative Ig domain-containing protein [Vibrio campbellii]WDG10038.1 putative Ig domain-containing protein [Vibrio campbellii]
MNKLFLGACISLSLMGCNSENTSVQNNEEPSFQGLEKITAIIGTPTTSKIHAYDNDGDKLVFSLSEQPNWVSISKEGLLTANPTQADVGDYQFKVIVSDGFVAKEAVVSISVELPSTPESDNEAPVVEDLPELELITNQIESVQVEAFDKESDELQFSLSGHPEWISIDQKGMITFKPKTANVGSHTYLVLVSDGVNITQKPMAVDVALGMTPVDPDLINNAPVIEAVPEISLVTGRNGFYKVKASDKNGDALTYSLIGQPSWVSISPTGQLNFKPQTQHEGQHQFIVLVSDGSLTAKQVVRTKVALAMTPVEPGLVNHAPTVSDIPQINLVTGKSGQHQVIASDKNGDALTYTLEGQPEWATISQSGSLSFSPKTTDEGTYTFNVLVSDGSLTTTRVVTTKVALAMTPVEPGLINNAPEVEVLPELKLVTGKASQQQVVAFDKNGDALTFALEGHPDWISIDKSGLLSFKPATEHEGVHTFKVLVSDGSLTTIRNVTVDVALAMTPVDPDLVNNIPEIASIPVIQLVTGRTGEYQVVATDKNGDALTYALEGQPSWVAMDATGLMSFAPQTEDEGKYTFNVLVSDGSLTAKSEVNLNVALAMTPVDPDLINHAPVWEVVKLPTAVVGDEYHFQIKATDQDGDEISYSIQNAPSWLSIDSKTGWIDGLVTEESLGDVELEVSASDDGLSAVQSVVLSTEGKMLEMAYNDVHDVTFETPMTLPSAEVIYGSAADDSALEITKSVYVDDVVFEHDGSDWYLLNKTHMPLGVVAINYQGAEFPALLDLGREIPPYTKVKLALDVDTLEGLTYVNQKTMFDPNIGLGWDTGECSDKAKTCYNSPKIGPERETFERTLAYIHEAFNRVSYVEEVEKFFKANCSIYSVCTNHVAKFPDAINYGYHSYLSIGQPGHDLTMRSMRNNYAAEGMGGGSWPDISVMESAGGGWASIWEEYVDVNHGAYRILPMNTLFHEIAHAYSYSHSSGWTYGFADYTASTYIPSLGMDVGKKPVLTSSDLIASYEIVDSGIRIGLKSKVDRGMVSNVKFRFATNKKASFKVNYLNVEGKNTIDVKFDVLPTAPIHIQIWDDESTYLTTLKFDAFMLVDHVQYETEDMRFTVVSSQVLNKLADGWAVRKHCDRPDSKMRLATRAQYQELYDYLQANDKLGEMPYPNYLTYDEPTGYRIWNVHFEADKMTAWHHNMYDRLGENRGLVCAEAITH